MASKTGRCPVCNRLIEVQRDLIVRHFVAGYREPCEGSLKYPKTERKLVTGIKPKSPSAAPIGPMRDIREFYYSTMTSTGW